MRAFERWAVGLAAAWMVGCGGAAKAPRAAEVRPAEELASAPAETPDAPFRQGPPAASGSLSFEAPSIEKRTLRSGVEVYIAHKSDVPLATVQVVTRGGAEALAGSPAASALLGAVMSAGAGARDALALSDRVLELGAQQRAHVGWSSAQVGLSVPSQHLDEALSLALDIAFKPTLPADEFDRARTRRLAALARERSSASSVFHKAVARVVFGPQHAYGRAFFDEESRLEALRLRELTQAHATLFAQLPLAIVLAGDVDVERALAQLEAHFGARKRAVKAPQVPSPPAASGAPFTCELKPGAQSQIGVAGVGADVRSPDRDALSVMNAVLGGAFSSRLNLNLRERHAYTYGARSSFDLRVGTGLFTASAAVVADKTAPALQEMKAEIERMRDSDVTEQELRMAKDYLKLSLPARFETVESLAGAAAELFVFGLPADELATRAARIEAIGVADVRRVAQRYLQPERLQVVVVAGAGSCEELAPLAWSRPSKPGR